MARTVAAGQPGRVTPIMPPASDLPSLINAVNAAAKIIATLAGPGPQPNNIYQLSATVSSDAARSSSANGSNTPRAQVATSLPLAINNSTIQNGGAAVLVPSTWREESRATRPLTIYHHDNVAHTEDKTQYVDIVRIDQLGFSPDTSSTEQAMIWRYGKPDPR